MKQLTWDLSLNAYKKKYVDMEKSGLFSKKPTTNNRILTDKIQLSLGRKQNYKNNHVFVIADPCDAEQHYILPNILQFNSNYVITDPGGEIYKKTQKAFQNQGYCVHTFSLMNTSPTTQYNPFEYLTAEDGSILNDRIENLVDTFIASSELDMPQASISVKKIERLLLLSLVYFLVEAVEKSDRNFSSLAQITRALLDKPDDLKIILDTLMNDWYQQRPNSIAVLNYQKIKLTSIDWLIEAMSLLNIRLQMFRVNTIKELTSNGTLDIKALANPKQVLFIIMPQHDTVFNPIAAMLCQQITEVLVGVADQQPSLFLPTSLSFMIHTDSVGVISDLWKRLFTAHKKNIGYSLITSSMSSCESRYKSDCMTLLDACDSLLFLSCPSKDGKTLELISFIAKSNISPEEIGNLPSDQCLYRLLGHGMLQDRKYQLHTHSNF